MLLHGLHQEPHDLASTVCAGFNPYDITIRILKFVQSTKSISPLDIEQVRQIRQRRADQRVAGIGIFNSLLSTEISWKAVAAVTAGLAGAVCGGKRKEAVPQVFVLQSNSLFESLSHSQVGEK